MQASAVKLNKLAVYHNLMSAKKSSSITFRIDEKYEKTLRKTAEERKVSLNTLANQIFGNFAEFDTYAEKFGILKISTDTFRRLLVVIPQKDLAIVASNCGSEEAKEFILFKWKEIDYKNVIEFIKTYFVYCGYGQCDIESRNGKTMISVHHDLGEKGSLYLKHFLEGLIMSTLNKESKILTTKDSISLNFSN